MFRPKLAVLALSFAFFISPVFGQDRVGILGPTNVTLNGVAVISVPADCVFLNGDLTRQLVKAQGDEPTGREAGMIHATNYNVFFEYNNEGHVKDDDKNKLDSMADSLLDSYKQGAQEQNKARAANKLPQVEIVGWEVKPHYDEVSHNLTWAIRGTIGGEPILNYNTRLLGRVGYMEVVLACDPGDLPQTLPAFNNLLASYSFSQGQTYAEYRPGDKIAKYGLAALVVGGAGVAAAKLGLLAWLLPFLKKGWMLIVAAFAAIGNFFRKLFAKITGRKNDPPSV